MRYLSRAVSAGGSLLAAALLTACGSTSGTIPVAQAGTLRNEVMTVSNDINNGQCISANQLIQRVQTQVAELPGTVDPTLVSDLSRTASTVLSLAKTQCGPNVGTGSDTTSTPAQTKTTAPPGTTTTTSTATTPTNTTPTNTTPTSTNTTPSTTTSTPSTPATTTTTTGTSTTGTNGGATLPSGGGAQNGQ